MGFIKEIYSNNRAGLVVVFGRGKTSESYFDGDSVEEAMQHFNLYLKNNELYTKTDNEVALNNLAIKPQDAVQFRNSVNIILATLTDEQAIKTPILFPIWQPNTEYSAGDRVRYENKLYKVVQNHISQNTWLPLSTPSLYTSLLIDEEFGKILNWIQPDSTNGYSIGNKVFHSGKTWISLLDNNVFEPGLDACSWEESAEEWNPNFTYAEKAKVFYQGIIYISLQNNNTSIPSENASFWAEENIPNWTTGVNYMIGDKIIYENETYESLIDNNVWSPVEYPAGWLKI